jgi:hypothetical protein
VIGLGLAWVAGCGIENLVRGQDALVVESVTVEETFQQEPHPKVDLLFVVDNTGSMADEQAALGAAFGSFVGALDGLGLAWHLGVVTTEFEGERAGLLHGDPWIITPHSVDAEQAFVDAVSVGTEGVEERGLAAMLLALSAQLSEDNRGFRREDAALHVVVVSDGDDHSDEVLGSSAVDLAIQELLDQADETGLPAQLSAVVGDVPGGCKGSSGQAFPGTLYVEVAEASGGTWASICSAELEDIVTQLGELSASYPSVFELQALPDDEPRVAVDGQRQDEGWTLLTDPPAIAFDLAPPAGALIQVRYSLEAE